jgi:anti-repressor protein|nr:MAG TPA: repressor domain protein [Bacteriophage sp.]
MEEIKIFENAQFGQIRTAVTEKGEPLFCLSDLCKILGLGNPSQAKKTLRKEGVITNEVGVTTGTKANGEPAEQVISMNFITEPNLYKCIFQSRKEVAEQFQDWVCGEVLPSIRKSGGYMVAKADETPEQLMARALEVAHETLAKRDAALQQAETKNFELQCENEQLKPGATFAKAVETSKHSILVGELAKIIRQNGVEIGQNRLFEVLREKGYLCKKGEMYNQPTQKALDLKLFEIKKTVIQKPSGETIVTTTTKVTGKGQIYFVNKFLREQRKSQNKRI